LEILFIVVLLVFGTLGLHFGAEWLVSGSSRIALAFGVKPLIIGLTIVSFGTSAPELTVSLGSSLMGSADLAVGNIIGSNIANIGLVLGLSALIRPIKIAPEVFKRDLPFMLLASVLVAVLPFIGGPIETDTGVSFMVGRWKGAVLVAVLIGFFWFMVRDSRGTRAALPKKERSTVALVILTVVGLLALLLGGKLFVDGAVMAAFRLGVPELVIGLTVVAIGTSLPELATSLVAIARGESAISLGNVVGSNIFNICLVLGVVALITPLALDARVMRLDMIVMLGFSAAVGALAWRGKILTRLEGGILLGAYVAYVANLFGGWV
jgi:cation:H+ antiporter